MDEQQQIEARMQRWDSFWNGPRLTGLLLVSLAIAIAVIYTIASVRSGNFMWNPFAHDPATELPPAGW